MAPCSLAPEHITFHGICAAHSSHALNCLCLLRGHKSSSQSVKLILLPAVAFNEAMCGESP